MSVSLFYALQTVICFRTGALCSPYRRLRASRRTIFPPGGFRPERRMETATRRKTAGDSGQTHSKDDPLPPRLPPPGKGVFDFLLDAPAVRNWNMPLLDASFRALVPLHQNRSRHVNCIQAHKAWMQADPQREFIRILASVRGVHHAGSDFD